MSWSEEPQDVQTTLFAALEKALTLVEVTQASKGVQARRVACRRLLQQIFPRVNGKNVVCVAELSFVIEDTEVDDLTPKAQTIRQVLIDMMKKKCPTLHGARCTFP